MPPHGAARELSAGRSTLALLPFPLAKILGAVMPGYTKTRQTQLGAALKDGVAGFFKQHFRKTARMLQ